MDSLDPFAVRYFRELLRRLGIRLVHINGLAGAAFTVAAHESGIPIVTHMRSFMGKEIPELIRYSSRIITVSEAVAHDIRRSDIDTARIVPIHNGQTFTAFSPERYDRLALRQAAGIAPSTKVLALIARIGEQKRQKFLLQALPALVARHPDTLALIVGETYAGEIPYLDQLKAMVKELGLME